MNDLKNRWINFPFSPEKFGKFYGPIIISIGVFGMLMSIPGQTMGVSPFTEPIIEDLHIIRDDISLAYLIGTCFSGFLITFVGILYDKYGSRIVGTATCIILGIALIYLSRIKNIAVFLESNSTLSRKTIIVGLLSIGFFGIRFFGQGTLTMVSRNMVMKWYDKRRGLANAFLGSFVTGTFSASPYLLFLMVKAYTWSGAWFNLGIFLCCISSIVIFIFFRDNPQQCGQIPDGKVINETLDKNIESTSGKNYRLKEAFRTYSFWIYTFTLVMHGLYATAVSFQIESIFTNAGWEKKMAFLFFIPMAIITIATNIYISKKSDFIRLKYLLITYLAALNGSMISLFYLNESTFSFMLVAFFSGIASAFFGLMLSIVWPRFFGTKYLGEITGFVISCTVIGTAIGPHIFSMAYDKGSYNRAIIICLSITFLLFLLSFKANNVNLPAQKK